METAVLTCPHCGGESQVEIPVDKCLPFAKCSSCQKLIAAKPPSCCVVCSYSDSKCGVSTIK